MKNILFAIACVGVSASAARAQFLSDPTPVRAQTDSQITFTKELTGYQNYGTDGRADILYTGNTAAYTFTLTQSDLNQLTGAATFQAIMSLDDHYSVPISSYSFTAAVNNVSVTSGTTTLAHGAPFNSIFTNWTPVNLAATPLVAGTNTLRFTNTSNTGATNWIAIDRITLSLPTSAAPEPSALTLVLPLMLGTGWLTYRRRARLQMTAKKNNHR